MFLTAFFFPSLPVLLAAVMALPVFALTALLSKKATERLAKEQGEPSDIEAGFYWLHNASRIFNQALTVIVILGAVVIVPLAAVFIPVSLRMQTIEKNAAEEGSDLENNREYKALKTLDNKLWFLRDPYLPFFPALVALAFFAIAKLFFNL